MSSSSTSGSLFTPLQFTGISQYSSDFQSILTRAVSIAQLPVHALLNRQTNIQQEETELTTLGAAATSVGSALKASGQLGSGQAFSATSTDNNVVTVTNTGASAGTSYSITNVTSLASAASETSTSGYASGTSTPVSTTGTMQLVSGSKSYPITLGSGQNNLVGLKNAINSLGIGVTASILTAGPTDYLAVAANSPGATTLQLRDDPTGANTNILTSSNQGKNTSFNLNGIPISEPSTTINDVVPGLTFNFLGTTAPNETVSVNLATDRSQISSALQTLVSGYNALSAQENTEFGTGGGLLSGNNIIYQLRQAMSSIVQYQGSGSMGNLANIGIEMDRSGKMSLNQQTFNSLTDSQISSSLQLFGSSTTGIGGLQQAFNSLTDPITGTMQQQQSQWNTTSTNLANQIATKNTQILAMEQTLNRQLQAADAIAAKLTSQQSMLTASITSLNYTSYGYNTNNKTA
jgi:flagellar hook-associated protein 2